MARLPAMMAQGRRRTRHPAHTFAIRFRPFEITPFLIAPVLPGETMKNLLIQSQTVSNALKNTWTGWWLEYFFFYVKHRDLNERAFLEGMMLDPSTDISSLRHTTRHAWKYVFDDGVDYDTMCLTRIVQEYFRDEGEDWDDYVITAGRPAAQINNKTWLDSVVDYTTILQPDDPAITVGVDDQVTAGEIDAALRQWEMLRDLNLTNQTYEDYLATYGVRPKSVELHRPELIRHIREWKYPGGMVPGSVTNLSESNRGAILRWSIADRADKDRYFREPGFIVGLCLARPKVYLRAQTGAGVGMLDDVYAWLPAVLSDDPATSLKRFAVSQGPLQSTTNEYIVDLKDLFMYGDQYVNFDLAAVDNHLVDLPNAALTNKKYPDSDDVNTLFVTPATENELFSDGVVQLHIATTLEDTTPQGVGGFT